MLKTDSPKIVKGYTDNEGNYFDINNVIFPTNNTPYYFGEFITSSHDDENQTFSSEEEGKRIYRSYDNPNKGYRIYKNLFFWTDDFKCNDGVFDAKLVSELQKKQPFIKLTDFPTGVVTINNSVIGQEIPLYNDNYINLHSLPKLVSEDNYLDKLEKLKMAYLSIIDSVEELIENDIIYLDIHRGNFLFNKTNPAETKIVDFEKGFVYFDKPELIKIQTIVYSLAEMFDNINSISGVEYEIEDFDTKNPIKDLKQKIKTFK